MPRRKLSSSQPRSKRTTSAGSTPRALAASLRRLSMWTLRMLAHSLAVGRYTANRASNRPERKNSLGREPMSLAVAKMKQGVVFSCIHPSI